MSCRNFRVFLALCLGVILVTGILVLPRILDIYDSAEDDDGSIHRMMMPLPHDQLHLVLEDDPRIIRSLYLIPPPPPSKLRQSVSWLLVHENDTRLHQQNPVVAKVLQYLGNKTKGFFVETSNTLADNISVSNTLELERHFGWWGLIVEPDPRKQLELNERSRNAWIAQACLSPKGRPVKMNLTRFARERPDLDNSVAVTSASGGKIPKTFISQCFTLYSILVAANGQTEVDYLSLNVEGAEWYVLRHVPFDRVTIKVISMRVLEQRGKDRVDLYRRIVDYLKDHGYTFKTFIEDEGLGLSEAIFVLNSKS